MLVDWFEVSLNGIENGERYEKKNIY